MAEKILSERNLVIRHDTIELIEHWAIAISGLVLLVTGIFELPVVKRYYVITVPGLGWSADFIVSLYLHYAAAFVFTATGIFHLLYHGLNSDRGLLPRKGDLAMSIVVIKSLFGIGQEPPMHKYLPEQRLAYAGMAFIILMLILSGLVKTYKNIYAPDMSHAALLWATWIHNLSFILFFLAFLAHMAAIALKPNWPMVRGIFTGRVRLDYALHRHSLWLADIEKVNAVQPERPKEPILPTKEEETFQDPQAPTERESLSVVPGEPESMDDEATDRNSSSDGKEDL